MAGLTSTHWGAYEVDVSDGVLRALRPFHRDADPSPIGTSVVSSIDSPTRVRRPAVRRDILVHGRRTSGRHGSEPFVEVSWDVALDLVAGRLREVIAEHGNGAVFGGSYGWSSAGRFHHAQSQVHRFLNTAGGYVGHLGSYSLGAAIGILPHILAPMDQIMRGQTAWPSLAAHCRLFVAFGGIAGKNAQVSPGGASEHTARGGLAAMKAAGAEFVNISPLRSDVDPALDPQWLPIVPGSDAALMLALCHTLLVENRYDKAFVERYCVGFERFVPYLLGQADGRPKDAAWAAAITGIAAAQIVALARRMAGRRTMINVSWSIQRADHGEQPYWAATALAAMLGQIGLPGGGVGFGYGAINGIGAHAHPFSGPTLDQGKNAVKDGIPVARIADALLSPGEAYEFNGRHCRYPDLRFVYWAGGNAFHHHQDLNRLRQAWQRPDWIVVHEQFWTAQAKHADVVLPATLMVERDDIGAASRDRFLIAMKAAVPPVGEARDDYWIFSRLAERLGVADAFTGRRDVMAWLQHLYDDCRGRAATFDIVLPAFDAFWRQGHAEMPAPERPAVLFEAFRQDPAAHPLATPSGRIELFSAVIDGFRYDDCPGHPAWLEPEEWLGAPASARFPLHLLSHQPSTRLHSQYDHGSLSRAGKVAGREPLLIHPDTAAARGLADGDIARVFNDRGACLAGVRTSRDLRPDVVVLATGAWYDPDAESEAGSDVGAGAGADGRQVLCKHGSVNVLTPDRGTSRLAQACSAQSTLVQIERFGSVPPAVTAFDPPVLLGAEALTDRSERSG